MVLKIHRSAIPVSFPATLHSPISQPWSCIISGRQGETGLSRKAQVGVMDVSIAASCPQGMGFHEGMSSYLMYFASAAANCETKVLHEHGFPVPKPIDHTRHCVLMSYIDAYPLWVSCRSEHPYSQPHHSGDKSRRFPLLGSCILRLWTSSFGLPVLV